ncbi:MAG: hypothetical protein J2P46_04265 [Zavarzinella sp.]|nr:hypothetical protein [Zavarzinella sp.]
MKVPSEVLERLRKYPQHFPLPLEPMHGWRSAPDEGGHTHCESCRGTIYPGDPVVGCYLRYVSVVFCPACVIDNPGLFREWLAPRPG